MAYERDGTASGLGPGLPFTAVAWLDKQVSNQATEIMARSLGVPNLVGSVQQGLQEISDQTGPLNSALVTTPVLWLVSARPIKTGSAIPTITVSPACCQVSPSGEMNAEKYPADKVRGKALKYSDYHE